MTDIVRAAPDYQPYVAGSFRWRLGLRPLDLSDWIQFGDDYDHEMDAKAAVLREHHDTVVAVLDGIEEEAATGMAAGPLACFLHDRPDLMDRLYRPQALDVPVLTSRDGPIASIDPRQSGTLAGTLPQVDLSGAVDTAMAEALGTDAVQVVASRAALA